MIVIHAIWDNLASGKLHLWAESPGLPMTVRRSRKRQAKRHEPEHHPFTLNRSALIETVGGLSGGLIAESAGSGNLILLLPSTSNAPLPSPELILEEKRADADKETILLTQWNIRTLTLGPNLALEFFLSLPNGPPHGVAFGSSLRFWAEAAKLSLELIIRQCFVPTVRETRQNGNTSFHAAWEAVLGERDAERIHLLSKAMPPICRAFVLTEKGHSQAPLPLGLTSNFLNQTVDAFVRSNLSSIGLFSSRHGHRPKIVSLSEQWLRALSSGNPMLTGNSKELKTFSAEVRSWLSEIRLVDSNAPFRTCLRFEPPDDHEDSSEWRISFHLQANDDRSLLVSADEVWKARSSVATFLKRRFENPQERLLEDLGKASRLFPVLEECLQTARPTELKLNAHQAYKFLRESAPLLEQSGFGVMLPSWWQKPTRLGVKLMLKPERKSKADARTGLGLMGMDALVSYDLKIALGDNMLSLRELEELVKLKIPLVRARGQWVELQPEEIEKAIAFFKEKRGNREMRLGEALRLGLGQEESQMGLSVVNIEGDGWIKDFLSLSHNAEVSMIETPQTFNGVLRPYQRRGVSWLSFLKQFGLGACLADDMGLGKTIELIALLLHERSGKGGRSKPGPTLLVCPMSIVGNWQREIQRFAPSLKVMIHHGAERLSGREFGKEARKYHIVITTYSLTHRDEERLINIDWECVVLDEAQNIKNPSAKQTQAVKKLTANYKIALTGTPVENRLSELWSIMSFLNPGYLGSAKDFHARFATPIERYRDVGCAERLKRLIGPFVLRRLKTDKSIINDLPEKMDMKVFCNLTEEQASLYEAVVKEMIEKIESSEGIERRGLVLATLMKLKQVCNHPAHFVRDGSPLPGRSGKLARLEEMLEEVLAGEDKALIFTQFAEMGTMLRSHLQETLGCEALFLHGGTPKNQRDLMVQRFQDGRHGPSLFILSLKAGGVGLNLTAANHVFHFDRWWNPAVEDQATDRAFRIGQKKNVQAHKFVCIGTLEERIDLMIEQKKELAESIVGSGENWITEMSTSQLKELFALSRDAVAVGNWELGKTAIPSESNS